MSIWPPIIVMFLIGFGSFNALFRYGEMKKPDRYDWVDVLVAPALTALLLWWGGFWEPLLRAANG